MRDFVKESASQTLIDNLYWLWFFYSKDTVQTLRSGKFAMINPISYHWSLSISPENIRKPDIFLCFQGVSKETSGMKWVNSSSNFQQDLFKELSIYKKRRRTSWAVFLDENQELMVIEGTVFKFFPLID